MYVSPQSISPAVRSAYFASLEPRQITLQKPPKHGVTSKAVGGSGPAFKMGASGSFRKTKYHGAGDAPSSTTVSDNGGEKMSNAVIAPLFWGNAWTNAGTVPSAHTLMTQVRNLLTPWSDGTSYFDGLWQYGVTSDSTAPVVVGVPPAIITNNPPNQFGSGDVGSMILSLSSQEPSTYGSYNNFIFMVFMPPGVSPANTKLGGDHTNTSENPGTAVSQWLGNEFGDGGGTQIFAWVAFNPVNNGAQMTRLFSHELVETMTDPNGDAIQVNPRNSTNWNEIGDVCNSAGTVNGVYVTSYFSAADQACIIPQPPAAPPPPLPPGDYQIDCAVHTAPWQHITHHYIFSVGGPKPGGGRWELTVPTVVDLIKSGQCTFYTNEDGRRAKVTIETSATNWPYLKTVADGFTPNNLESLAGCDGSSFVFTGEPPLAESNKT
jgi:hypothetical protein